LTTDHDAALHHFCTGSSTNQYLASDGRVNRMMTDGYPVRIGMITGILVEEILVLLLSYASLDEQAGRPEQGAYWQSKIACWSTQVD